MALEYRIAEPEDWPALQEALGNVWPEEYDFPSPSQARVSAAFDPESGKPVAALFLQPAWHFDPLVIGRGARRKHANYKRLLETLKEDFRAKFPRGTAVYALSMPEGKVSEKMCQKAGFRKLRDVTSVWEAKVEGSAQAPEQPGLGPEPREEPRAALEREPAPPPL